MRLSVASFDIGNTLLRIPDGGGFCTHFSRVTGRPFDDLRPLFLRYFLTQDLPMRHAVELACTEIGYTDPGLVVDSYGQPNAVVFDDVLPAIRKLREAGVKIVAISNCAPWDAGGIADTGLGSLLDEVFYSFQIGAAKPHPSIFVHAQEALHARPKEMMHIGDNWAADVEGAISAGWAAVLLDRGGATIRSRQSDRVRVIRSLEELV